MKFTAYEANGSQLLVAHSPLLSWMYGLLTVEQFSKGLGKVEVMIAVLIGLRHWSAKASAKLTLIISKHWNFTTQSGGIWTFPSSVTPGKVSDTCLGQIRSKHIPRTYSIESVLARDLDDLEPHLMRHGYNAKALADLLNIRPAEIRAFLAAAYPTSRTQELQQELLTAGLPL